MLAEAERKDRHAEDFIEKRTRKRVRSIKEDLKDQYEEKTRETKRKVSISTYILSVYSVALTLVWSVSQWKTLARLPEWFSNRWKDLSAFCNFLYREFIRIHDRIPETWSVWRWIIPAFISLVLLLLSIMGLILLFLRLKRAWNEKWEKYYGDDKRIKTAMKVFLLVAAFLVAVLVSSLWKEGPLWPSWWLLLSAVFECVYHAAG